jgi:hypothetical protein
LEENIKVKVRIHEQHLKNTEKEHHPEYGTLGNYPRDVIDWLKRLKQARALALLRPDLIDKDSITKQNWYDTQDFSLSLEDVERMIGDIKGGTVPKPPPPPR